MGKAFDNEIRAPYMGATEEKMAVVQGIQSQAQYASSGTLARKDQRSFAELYRQARAAQANDSGSSVQTPEDELSVQQEANRNREFIAGLHDRVDTLRGEILARAIIGGQNKNPDEVGKDISRLNTRLESLRSKLREEETRLSGHLLDIKV